MGKMTKRKDVYITNWKEMPVEDKILLVMEGVCYFLAVGTLMTVIFVTNKGLTEGVLVLFLIIFGFAGCGLNARSSRNSYIGKSRLDSRMNKHNTNKQLEWN